jgi:hypothetical protein
MKECKAHWAMDSESTTRKAERYKRNKHIYTFHMVIMRTSYCLGLEELMTV